MTAPDGPWLLLIHQLPAEPGYRRVKLWRRLRRLGAVQLKSSVWGLPAGDEAMEDFQWLVREIEADGGEALMCHASFIGGLTERQVTEIEAAERAARSGRGRPDQGNRPRTVARAELRNRIWVTRSGVKADRIGSAWFIRRHVDSEAVFKFVASVGYAPLPGELRFDMYEAEFTHDGDACTFEVLACAFLPEDPAIAAIAEVVHDIDFKTSDFGRPETEGFRALLIDGVCRDDVVDPERMERGFRLFDALREAFLHR